MMMDDDLIALCYNVFPLLGSVSAMHSQA